MWPLGGSMSRSGTNGTMGATGARPQDDVVLAGRDEDRLLPGDLLARHGIAPSAANQG